MTEIYSYDAETGEYLTAQLARRDPIDNDIVLSRNATALKPPNRIERFVGNRSDKCHCEHAG